MTTTTKQRKVCVVITARPSYSRVRSVLIALRDRCDVELQVVVTGSAVLERYGNVTEVIEADGFLIAGRAYTMIEGETLVTSAKSTGMSIIELTSIFDTIKPDVVVTVADRFETLATAVSAAYINVPVAHIQGGEVTGSIDEKVRHAVCKLSNLHFASTALAAKRIIRLGENPDTVFYTGCPSIDIAADVLKGNIDIFNPFDHYGGVGAEFDVSGDFIVVLQHPVTTEYDDASEQVSRTLEAVSMLGINTFWFWPNIDAGSDSTSKMIRRYREDGRLSHVHLFRNLKPDDFLKLMLRSRCIVGNSSVALREGSFLGVPAVNIGSRQQFRERGVNVIDVDYDLDSITEAIKKQCSHGHYASDKIYGSGDAGRRIAELLAVTGLRSDKVLSYALEGEYRRHIS